MGPASTAERVRKSFFFWVSQSERARAAEEKVFPVPAGPRRKRISESAQRSQIAACWALRGRMEREREGEAVGLGLRAMGASGQRDEGEV